MKIVRPSINSMMLEVAENAAKRSTCPEAHVGAVIATLDGQILSFGYNGVPRGMAHCTDTGCIKDENGHHLYVVHAELNAILNAARQGVCVKGAVLYCTRFPCIHCTTSIVQAGIAKVVFESVFKETPTPEISRAMAVFSHSKVMVIQEDYEYE